MIKQCILACVFVTLVVGLCNAIGLEGDYRSITGSISFGSNNSIALDLRYPEVLKLSGEYTIDEDNELIYLVYHGYRWLCLYSTKLLILYNSEGFPFFFGINGSAKFLNNFGSGSEYEVSSFFEEDDQVYDGENLSNLVTFSPWVEGSEGDGLSDWVKIKGENLSWGIAGLVIYNGFVSYEKPALYKKNNRVRSLRVYDSDDNFMSEIYLEDTPNPQFVKLPYQTDAVKLEINSVYPGSTWSDTCINSISIVPGDMVNFFDHEYDILNSLGERAK